MTFYKDLKELYDTVEQIYKKRQIGKEVLDEGEYLGFKYMILSLSTHPCAYRISLLSYWW